MLTDADIDHIADQHRAALVEAWQRKDPRGGLGDYPEDTRHEDGLHILHCTECGDLFMGLSRRMLCRVCQDDYTARRRA